MEGPGIDRAMRLRNPAVAEDQEIKMANTARASVLFHLTAFDGLANSEGLLDSIRLRSVPLHGRLKK